MSDASCHSGSAGPRAAVGSPLIALVGAPNVGKSTLFNALTGARVDVGNYPGTTVEVARGRWHPDVEYDLLDLPGAYSLDPVSPDEEVARDILTTGDDRPACVIVVADASRLSRSLYLVVQLLELHIPCIVALTMTDVAERRGLAVDAQALAESLGTPVVVVDPRRRRGMAELGQAVGEALRSTPDDGRAVHRNEPRRPSDDVAAADRVFTKIATAIEAAVRQQESARRTWSDRIDRVALAPILGPLVFLLVMWAVFQATTTIAAPLQGWLDELIAGPISDGVRALFAAVSLGGSWLEGLIVDGLIAGVGMLLTFIPLMAIMFTLLALLEDSGYMARAAVVTDRAMRAIGLPGRAFLPLIVGFGCNVPAIAATRVLPNARHRILTALLVPFTSCTARLTVYVLVATIFFPDWAGTVVFAMYVISILFVIVVGLALRRTLWRTMGSEPLILDLPPYQRPTVRVTSAVMWVRLRGFLRTAGGIIVATVIAVWFLQAIPAPGTQNAGFADVPVQDSLYAATARTITPVFAPTGFGEWETTSALMVGFIAKEAVVSSWAQTYAVAEPESPDTLGDLGTAIRTSFERSSGGHVNAAVWAFLVFLLAYTPCVATLAAQRREIGMRWTWFGVGLQLSVAWIAAVAIFQIGSRLG